MSRHLHHAYHHLLPTTYSTKCLSDLHSSPPPLPRRLPGGSAARKPSPIPIIELKRRARSARADRRSARELPLRPPDNGLLVPHLISLAHAVLAARRRLHLATARALAAVPAHSCRACGEVHVGHPPHRIRTCPTTGEHAWTRAGIGHVLPRVESFHLYDRIGRAVSHEERLEVDRIPALVELCVQAGVDLPEYPTRRRQFPVYNVAGKVIDFEKMFPRSYESGKDVEPFGFWLRKKKKSEVDDDEEKLFSPGDSLRDVATRGMEAWEVMRSGAQKLMEKYPAQTCGYCPEVQVGPKGHKARICQAFKHQMRDGQHGWQPATIDDLVPPVYVWHVPDPQNGEPLLHELRAYYGKLPAAVELFAQAGADIGESYRSMMRDDVVVPGVDEEKLAV